MAKCKHKMGLLSLRTCGLEAATRCQQCNIAICHEHMVLAGDAGLCFECAAEARHDPKEGHDGLRQVYRRRSYYDAYGYNPFWYHHHYSSFDQNVQDEAIHGFDQSVQDDASHDSASDEVIDANDFQDS